MSQKRVMIYKK